MPDTRKPWEVEYCLRIKFSASYVEMMQSTGIKRQLLKNVYGEDLDGFCKKHIKEILTKCDALENEHGPLSTAALSVVQGSLDVLRRAV